MVWDKDVQVNDIRSLTGNIVVVEGIQYYVNGVDHWAIECSGLCCHGFGLLVRKVIDMLG